MRDHGSGTTEHKFVPVAIESYGRLGKHALGLLKDWADTASSGGGIDRDGFLTWIKREISVAMIKGNGRTFRHYVGYVARSVGRRFMHGDSSSGTLHGGL